MHLLLSLKSLAHLLGRDQRQGTTILLLKILSAVFGPQTA
jgi:hypothetical protein